MPTNQREREERREEREERERERAQPAPKTVNNNHRGDPLAAAEIKTPLPPQLDGQADCWPTPESEINSLFSLMRENMQTSRRARRYAKPWQEDGGWGRADASALRLAEERPLPRWRPHPPISPCRSPSSASTCSEAWGETFPCHLLIHHSSVGWESANQGPPLNLTPSSPP